MSPQKYRKKPVEILAMQMPEHDEKLKYGTPEWSAQAKSNTNAVGEIAKWILTNGGDIDDYGINFLTIETLEGEMTARPGDYVIQGVNGEFYPCKPDIFAKTYEKLEN